MLSTSMFAETASLVGDTARANMLAALMDCRALTAKELADAAGITPQTASGHLAQLTRAGVLSVERQGRHRYHRVASPSVAHMLESIMAAAVDLGAARADRRKVPAVTGPRDRALRELRTCYDHLAGRIAVAMADRMAEREQIDLSPDGGVLSDEGSASLRRLGVNLDSVRITAARRRSGRVFCRPCLDWSERRAHIAGAVGAALCECCFAQGWLRRLPGTRAVAITPAGHLALGKAFALKVGA